MALPTLTFAAPGASVNTLIATATFEIQQTSGGTDWGASTFSLYITQNGFNTYGELHPYTTTRTPFTVQYAFGIIQGYTITLALDVETGTAHTSVWNFKLQGELIKR